MEQQASDERRVNTLTPEAHVCCLYETEDQLMAVLVPFILEGLEKNEKIICIEDGTSSDPPLEVVCGESADLGASLKTGQLTILKAEETYLRSGVFDPDEMIALLKGYTEEALAEGYAGLRVTGQMTWALRDLPGADRLLEYEARLNDFFPGSRCLALCRYPVKHFLSPLLLDVLRTHPQVVIGTEVYANPHYVPPSILLGTDRSALDLRRWIADMVQRKAGDAALRASEAYFREITENASDMVLIVNREGILTYVSPSIERFMGYRPEELMGRPAFDFIHPADRQRAVIDFAAAVQAQETAIPNSFRVLHKDGSERVFEGLGKNLLSHPAIAGFIMNVQDVTARVAAEQALREPEERFRDLFDEAPVGYFEYDLAGNITRVNRSELELLGYTAEEMIGQPCWEFIVDPEARVQILEKLAGNRPVAHSQERTYRRKDGTTFPVLFEDRLLTGKEGQITGIRTTIQDITEHKRAEEALREIEERFSGFAKASGYGFAIGKLSGELVFGNSAMLKIVEEDQESDFIAKTFYEYYTQEARRILETEILPFVMEKGQWKGELPLFTAKGNVAQTEQNIFLIRDQLGAPYMLGNITTDITERKASETEREKLYAQLMQAQKMESVGRLAGGVAHDFNNKLSVILGYTQLAMDGLDRGDPLYETLQQVLKAGNQSVDIVRQLLAFARKQTILPEVLDLNEVVEGMLKMLRRLVGEDLDLTWEPGRCLWSVKMDPSQIDQVLANLCVNARDAISGVGKVSIETQNTVLKEGYCAEHAGAVPGDYVMLAVSDTGCGMKRETLQSIFEPFFTTKELGKGTGLGLSTVYGIVKQNQGYIDVVSEPGRGACFRIYLPRHHGPAEREMETSEPSLLRGGGETILVVEDDASLLQLTQAVLAQAGYHVLAAASPIEAMEMVRQHDGEIDLLLTDIVMPQMSGVELANEIDKMRPKTKTLFMSGYARTAGLSHETRERAVPLLEKPFTPNSLTRKVGEVLGN